MLPVGFLPLMISQTITACLQEVPTAMMCVCAFGQCLHIAACVLYMYGPHLHHELQHVHQPLAPL